MTSQYQHQPTAEQTQRTCQKRGKTTLTKLHICSRDANFEQNVLQSPGTPFFSAATVEKLAVQYLRRISSFFSMPSRTPALNRAGMDWKAFWCFLCMPWAQTQYRETFQYQLRRPKGSRLVIFCIVLERTTCTEPKNRYKFSIS